jgi:superfamily II DNA or RNA helicase
MSAYAEFLERKRRLVLPNGIDPKSVEMPALLYDWQAAMVRWALRKGRAAIFADCGLGKTFMQTAWADALKVRTLMLAPLCVAEQTVAEAAKLGIEVVYCRDQQHAQKHRLVITNYERLEKFDESQFKAVVLDESSILKAFDGKTRTKLIETFAKTPYRLCCTATPAPNDIAELANHAEFLGLMTRSEFLATWFVHDDMGWRMKRHAVQPFYRWLASWAIALRRPSDLGYDDGGFALPSLRFHETTVESGTVSGALFPELSLKGIGGRLAARKGSLDARVEAAANLIHERGVSWIAWCGLNTESEALSSALPNAVEVSGSDDYAEKVGAVQSFIVGQTKVLVSKVRILGYGLNFQHCSHMVFVGLGDSYEQYYQAIRRCWRFGQKHPVDVHIVVSEAERLIVENVRRKEATADALSQELLVHMRDFEREELCA